MTTSVQSVVSVTAPASAGAEQRLMLRGVSWATYKQLSTALEPHPSVLLTYDRGALEIMTVSLLHEKMKKIVGNLVELIAPEMEIDFVSSAQTTLRLETEERGLEGDDSFYFTHLEQIGEQEQVDLTTDPAPDLAIEIDISNPSINKFPIYAVMGVSEIWRYHKEELKFFRLVEGAYVEMADSLFLPGVTAVELTELIAARQAQTDYRWRREVRAYAQQCRMRRSSVA